MYPDVPRRKTERDLGKSLGEDKKISFIKKKM